MICLKVLILCLDLANAPKAGSGKKSLKSDELQKQYDLVIVSRYVKLNET